MKKVAVFFASIVCFVTIFAGSASADFTTDIASVASLPAWVQSFYDASVLFRIDGRAGAATANGAKGIVHEVLFMDKLNKESFIKGDGLKTFLSKSSVDPVADVITVNADGEIVEMYQLKDGISYTQKYDTAKYMAEGKYSGAKLAGTTEFVEGYNPYAMERGLEKAVDTGISTADTSRIADLGMGRYTATIVEVLNEAGEVAGVAVVITAVASTIEAIINDYTIPEAVANILTNSGIAGSAAYISVIATAATEAVLATLIGGTIAAIGAPIAGFVVFLTSKNALENLADKLKVREKASEITSAAIECASDFKAYIIEMNIPEIVCNTMDSAAENIRGIVIEKIQGIF